MGQAGPTQTGTGTTGDISRPFRVRARAIYPGLGNCAPVFWKIARCLEWGSRRAKTPRIPAKAANRASFLTNRAGFSFNQPSSTGRMQLSGETTERHDKMNSNQIIRMISRILLRKVIRKSIDMGIRATSKQARLRTSDEPQVRPAEQPRYIEHGECDATPAADSRPKPTPEEKKKLRQDRRARKAAKQAAKMGSRITRM